MKKINLILLCTAILTSSFTTFADGDDDKTKGIRAGWQTSNYFEDGSAIDGATNLNSFYVGFSKDTKIIPLLHFGSGLEYFQNGQSSTLLGIETQFKAHTISIPLNLKLKLGPVFVLGGAGANFIVSQNLKVDGENIDIQDDEKLNFFDVPVYAGLGVKIFMFSVEARYHWGTIDADKSDASNFKAQYFQVGAGIHF